PRYRCVAATAHGGARVGGAGVAVVAIECRAAAATAAGALFAGRARVAVVAGTGGVGVDTRAADARVGGTRVGVGAGDRRANAPSGRALVAGRAGVTVVAGRVLGTDGVRAGAGRRVAGSRGVALVGRDTADGRPRNTAAALALIALRTGIVVAARAAIARELAGRRAAGAAVARFRVFADAVAAGLRVAGVSQTVVVEVRLGRVRDAGAVVGCVAHAVAVVVGRALDATAGSVAGIEAGRLGRTAGDAPTVVDLAERRAELRRAAVEAGHECLPAGVGAGRR